MHIIWEDKIKNNCGLLDVYWGGVWGWVTLARQEYPQSRISGQACAACSAVASPLGWITPKRLILFRLHMVRLRGFEIVLSARIKCWFNSRNRLHFGAVPRMLRDYSTPADNPLAWSQIWSQTSSRTSHFHSAFPRENRWTKQALANHLRYL